MHVLSNLVHVFVLNFLRYTLLLEANKIGRHLTKISQDKKVNFLRHSVFDMLV